MKSISNLATLCEGLNTNLIQTLYDFLETKGVIEEQKEALEKGEPQEDLAQALNKTLMDLCDEWYGIYTFCDYVSDVRKIPFWMGMSLVAEAIMQDIACG